MSSPKLVELCRLEGHTDTVWQVAWSPDGRSLASCSSDRSVRIWDRKPASSSSPSSETGSTGSGQCGFTLRAILDDAHQRTVRSVAWAPNGRYLATASFDGTVSVWEDQGDEFDIVASLEGHENEVKSVSWDASGTLLATCGRDKTVWIWQVDDDREFECVSVLHGHTQDVKVVRWHPTAERFASASYDDTIKFWSEDDDDWACSSTLSGHQSTVWDIAFNSAGDHLASVSDDKTMIVWRNFVPFSVSGDWKIVCTTKGHHDRCIYSVDWFDHAESGTPVLLASAGGDNCICVFSQNTEVESDYHEHYDLVARCDGAHDGDVNCVRFHPTEGSRLMASAGDDGLVKLWAIQNL